MRWLRSALLWAGVAAAVVAVLVAVEPTSDAGWLVAAAAMLGALLGVFFHSRQLRDEAEDRVVEAALRDPRNVALAADWIHRLEAGNTVRVRGAWVDLTPQGVQWRGLVRRSVRWDEIDSVAPWTMSTHGARAARGVLLHSGSKRLMISCTKKNFAGVLATCAHMALWHGTDR